VHSRGRFESLKTVQEHNRKTRFKKVSFIFGRDLLQKAREQNSVTESRQRHRNKDRTMEVVARAPADYESEAAIVSYKKYPIFNQAFLKVILGQSCQGYYDLKAQIYSIKADLRKLNIGDCLVIGPN